MPSRTLACSRQWTAFLAAALAGAILIATPAHHALAQPTRQGGAAWVAPSPENPRFLDIDFPGGTLGEYLAGLQAVAHANFITTPAAAMAPIQPIRVTGAPILHAVELPAKLTHGVVYEVLHEEPVMGADGMVESFSRPAYTFRLDLAIAQAQTPKPPILFDLDFPGGNVDQYVAAIRRANPRANIVVMPGAERFDMPAVSLKAATTSGAVSLLNETRRLTGPDAGEMLHVDRVAQDGPEAVFKVWRSSFGGANAAPTASAFSLSGLLDGSRGKAAKIEDVLSAIEAAMTLFDAPAVIKYHPETQILFIRGTLEQLNLISRTLDNIERGLIS